MTAKSVFRLTTQPPKYKDPLLNASFPQRTIMSHEDSVFMGLEAPTIRNSPHLLWQSLTPELRAEALRRAQLIHLLRQVNPNLQLCRKSSSQTRSNTAEKGIQVPDIRYEFATNRRFSARPADIKRSASFTAPGIRIQPRMQSQAQPNPRAPLNNTLPAQSALKANNAINLPRPSRASYSMKESTIQVTLKATPKAVDTEVTKNEDKEKKEKDQRVEEKENANEQEVDGGGVIVVEDENDDKQSGQKTERQVVVKTKDASSGDEDSVVVVLNQPRSEQGLERKYGQFFCRRCLRGWSSRSVWCVRHTCKVYIKQTCNMCNKLVNPYLVCRLPPINPTRKDHK